MGDYELALADFNHLLEILPDLGDAYFGRGLARLALGDDVGAEEDFMSAYVNGADNPRLNAILEERGIIE
jgi:tetratricopeptide (TPR) repeat protein